MKLLLWFSTLLLVSHLALSQGTYTATIVIEEIYWEDENEWWADFHAQLYLDDVSQPPSDAYYYGWYWRENGSGNFTFDPLASGYGQWHNGTDDEHDQYFEYYVDITLPNTQHVISPTVLLAKQGDPQAVKLYAKKEDGTPLEGFSADSIGLWTGYLWLWQPPAMTGSSSHFMSNGEYLKIKPNIAGLGEKFHRGLSIQGDFRYTNYDSYAVYYGASPNELTFHHRDFYDATIQAALIENTSVIGGTVQFKDPWLEDVSGYGGEYHSSGMSAPLKSHFSPWTISTASDYKGVFLLQSFPGWNPPYYSVGAPQPNSIGGFQTAYFIKWSGQSAVFHDSFSLNTPVYFTLAGATGTASYKAHLGSSASGATAYNTQRKLVKQGYTHHLAYQSAGDIFYVSSTDDGGTWCNEQIVSSSAETAPKINPALDTDRQGNVIIVYEYPWGPGQRALCVRQKSGSTWPLLSLAAFTASSELKPVIEVTKSMTGAPQISIVVKADDYNSLGAGLYWWRIEGQNSNIGKVSETSSTSVNPTITWYNLAYQDANGIYTKRITYGANQQLTFSARQPISPGYFNGRPVGNRANPSIAIRYATDSDRRPVIAWQAMDLVMPSYRPIFVRHPVGGTPQSPTFLITVFDWMTPNARGRTPTVNCDETGTQANPDGSLAWQDDPTDPNGNYLNVMVTNKVNGSWSTPAILTGGQSSSLAQGDNLSGPNPGSLFTSAGTSGPPYHVNFTHTNIPSKIDALAFEYLRGVNAKLSALGIQGVDGTISICVGQSDAAAFSPVATLAALERDFLGLQVRNRQRTAIAYGLSVKELTYPKDLPETALSQPVLVLEYASRDTAFQTQQVVTVSGLIALWSTREMLADSSYSARKVGTLTVPSGGMARLRLPDAILRDPANYDLLEVFSEPGASISKPGEASIASGGVPVDFALHPNYPNPFNPSTQIDYDLPREGMVSLVVYDVLGREVAELARGYHEAGFYTVMWNAQSDVGLPVASGVYLTRLIVTDSQGRSQFASVNKMLLTK